MILPFVFAVLSGVVITIPRYVINCNERRRLNLACVYTCSEQTEKNEKSQAVGTQKRSVTAHIALVQRREPDSWIYRYTTLTYLVVLLGMILYKRCLEHSFYGSC